MCFATYGRLFANDRSLWTEDRTFVFNRPYVFIRSTINWFPCSHARFPCRNSGIQSEWNQCAFWRLRKNVQQRYSLVYKRFPWQIWNFQLTVALLSWVSAPENILPEHILYIRLQIVGSNHHFSTALQHLSAHIIYVWTGYLSRTSTTIL